MTRSTEILIAGAGPVGLALANLLGRYGRTAIVVEARDTLIDYPRGVGLDDESFRSIQAMGLVDEVLPFTVPHHVMRLVNGRGEVILTNDPAGEPLGWARKWGFIQPAVDQVLADGLARFPGVDLQFGSKLRRGFFAEVIARLGLPEWESLLQDRLDTELGFEASTDSGTDAEDSE